MKVADRATELLRHPDLPLLVEKLQRHLADEAVRRQVFREWLDESKKAEFINGETVLHSPVKRNHLKVSANLTLLMEIYVRSRKLGEVLTEKALIALTRNDYKPDICFFTAERAASFTDDQMLFPAPDFVVEILSKSTAKYDRGIKLIDYAAHGVREYWIVDTDKQLIEQYLRVGEDSQFMPPHKARLGMDIKSHVIEGFEIPVEALFDEAACEEALQHLMAGKREVD
ncbi:MAG: Uma2 family endonuclease [Saprospiraceae bacterium]|nr:Uma2 family endonuclease [Saprospiraceae bacterium]MDW8228861.1 Uma2 family endonuclease [Saprospiraceae bacterium]